MLSVVAVNRISPNFIRVTFGGDDMAGFPVDSASANIKILLPTADQSWDQYLRSLSGVGTRPLKRTYTVREYREQQGEMDVDFALHSNPGPATLWAMTVKPGEQIAVAGPGSVKRINLAGDWFILAGDATALPAISANLTLLPEEARGYVIVELLDKADQQRFTLPENLTVKWLVNTSVDSRSALVDEIKQLTWLDGSPAVWIAGEATTVKQIRHYLIDYRKITADFRYTSGYWHIGHTEDSFQPIKRGQAFN